MQGKLRRWLWELVITLALTSVFSPLLAGEKKPSENTVAVVNGSVITQAELDREIHVQQRRLSRKGKPLTDNELSAIRKDALETLVDRELLYQESQKKGIKIDEAAVDQKFRKRFPDDAKFKNILSGMNLTEALLKSQFKRSMAIRQLIEKEIVKNVSVSEKEIKGYYDGHPNFFKQPEQVRASHILIKIDSKAD